MTFLELARTLRAARLDDVSVGNVRDLLLTELTKTMSLEQCEDRVRILAYAERERLTNSAAVPVDPEAPAGMLQVNLSLPLATPDHLRLLADTWESLGLKQLKDLETSARQPIAHVEVFV